MKTLKSIQPIEFQPIWAEYEKWDWKRQSDWALGNTQSDCRRRMFIEEQKEIAKEKRQAEFAADRFFTRLEPFIEGLVAAGVLRVK